MFHKLQNTWLILILIMAFFLRCWHLADIPTNLGGDEFTQALAARAFLCPKNKLKEAVYLNPNTFETKKGKNLLLMYFSQKGSRNFVRVEDRDNQEDQEIFFFIFS